MNRISRNQRNKKPMSVLKNILLFCTAPFLCFSVACGETGNGLPAETLLSKACDAAAGCDWKSALKLSSAAYRKKPDDTNVLIAYALVLENSGRMDEAFEIIRKAALDRTSFMAQYTLGRFHFRRGEYGQAIPPLKRAFELDGNDLNTILLLEQASAAGRSMDVKSYLIDHLWKKFPARFQSGKDPFILNELGLFFAVHNQPDHAIAAFQRAMQMAPDSPEINWNLAVVYDCHKKKQAAAIPFYEKFLRLTSGGQGRESDRSAAAARIRQIRH